MLKRGMLLFSKWARQFALALDAYTNKYSIFLNVDLSMLREYILNSRTCKKGELEGEEFGEKPLKGLRDEKCWMATKG